MAYTFVLAVLAAAALLGYAQYRGYRRYLAEAKNTGFKYVVCPVYFQSIPWILLQEALLPLLGRFPRTRLESWLPSSLFYRVWHFAYEPFAKAENDTFITASPSGNVLWTCEPNVINQVLNRRHDFTKPANLVRLINIYGPTITASEGHEHMVYRKIATTSINETTHGAAWNEAVRQAEAMTTFWAKLGGEIGHISTDTSRLAMHVLNKVFFDKDGTWTDDEDPPPGHKLTYNQASSGLFKYANTLFLIPRAILSVSPSESHQKAKLAYDEMKIYMEEMKAETERRLTKSRDTSLSEKEVGSSEHGSLRENFVRAGMPEFSSHSEPVLSAEAILGNFFVFTFASLETSANTLAVAFVLLACRPNFQKELQADIDSIFSSPNGHSPAGVITSLMEDKYMSLFNRLWNGHVGALMQEVLRLWNVVMFIPKVNLQTQTIMLDDGARHTLAANTLIMINVAATHRNPKYWPAPVANNDSRPVEKDDIFSTKNSLSEFRPERWLASSSSAPKYDPPQGAYIPFSDGFRACRGSRLARVEFCAAVARTFAEWTVELADRSPAGLRAAEESFTDGMKFEMTLFMRKPVKLKLVRRS